MKTRIAILAAVGSALIAAAWQTKASVEITAPANGATVSSPVKSC